MRIEAKKVELFELFYDLVFVYAISRVTLLLEEPVGGVFTFEQFFVYIISTLAVLQSWMYMTNYINRYGQWRWYEYVFLSINMFAAIFMSQTIKPEWDAATARMFLVSIMTMIVTVICLYVIQMHKKEQDIGAAKNGVMCLSIVLLLFIATLSATYTALDSRAYYLLSIAVLAGAFIPFIVPKFYDPGIVNFPHLVERYELLTIITFGEGVVGMTVFFDLYELSNVPWLVFLTIFLLFVCYVIQIHHLCDHHRVDRGLWLMFSHYFVILSVNLIDVAYLLFSNVEGDHQFTATLMFIALAVFFLSILANSVYYHKGIPFHATDILISLMFVALGAAIAFLYMDSPYGFLLGALTAASGNFLLLMHKFHKFKGTLPSEDGAEGTG